MYFSKFLFPAAREQCWDHFQCSPSEYCLQIHTCCSRYGKHELSVVFTMSILLGSSINKWETFSSKNQNIVILRWQSCFCESNLVTCINWRNGFHEPFSQEACVQGMPGTQHLLGNQDFKNVLQPDLPSTHEPQKDAESFLPRPHQWTGK